MTLIAESAALADFCGRLAGARYVAVDTEFMRERTYWPRLCLVQVAGGGAAAEDAAAIDALAPGLDLRPLFQLMADARVLKVFHSARQDLEIFHRLAGQLPRPVFDTQVAAMVCGFGDSVSYETLVGKLAKARMDKGSQFTDWARRPLSQRQIAYALADVIHLRTVYEKLKRKLEANGRAAWIDEEMAALTAPSTYALDPEQAFRRIKARGATPRFLAVLRELAAWREREAAKRDMPRNWLLRDEALVEIAHHMPATAADLARTRGLGRKLAEGRDGAALIEAVARGRALPDGECPRPEAREMLPPGIGPMADLLKVLLKMRCEEAGVAQRLVASAADVERLAAFGERAEVPALHGWRRDVFGGDALGLRAGETALAVREGRIVAIPAGARGAGPPRRGG
jgi:ribonuclease D